MKTLIYTLLISALLVSCNKESISKDEFKGVNKVTLKLGSIKDLVIILEDNNQLKAGNFEKRDLNGHLLFTDFTFSTDFNKFKLQANLLIIGSVPSKYTIKTTDWINIKDTVVVCDSIFKL